MSSEDVLAPRTVRVGAAEMAAGACVLIGLAALVGSIGYLISVCR